MSEKWLSGTSSESGILRKTKPTVHTTENVEELLIFGYACKIFRDDERAKLIDHGKHLIPWMGDNTLKIDRYDVRATLPDIAPYEPPPGGYTNRLGFLTPAEQRAEQLCEEERYYSLFNNDVDEELYQEEELKRLHKIQNPSYGQVAFDYNAAKPSTIEEKPAIDQPAEEPDELYVPHPKFYIPRDIEVPEAMKVHVVIEKTAKFIASQGPQMEILIKAKQSNNPLFEFLNQNNRLNKYYKHVLMSIKDDVYPSEEAIVEDSRATPPAVFQSEQQNHLDNINQQNQYLSPIAIPTLKYKPSADCSYTQLISKIKGVPMNVLESEATTKSLTETTTTTVNETPKKLEFSSTSKFYDLKTSDQPPHALTPPPPILLTNVPVPVSRPNKNSTKTTAAAVQLPTSNQFKLENDKIKANLKSMAAEGVEIKQISAGLMLAQCYNSETESEDDGEGSNKGMKFDFPIPPTDLQNIIDKTAAYVLKNGNEFENILRTKNDPRFSFLSINDEFHRYYIYKVTGIIYPHNNATTATMPETPSDPIAPEEAKINPKMANVKKAVEKLMKIKQLKSMESKVITSVSFSIKSKEEQPTFPLKPALPQEPSSDEEDSSPIESTNPNDAELIKKYSLSSTNVPDTPQQLLVDVQQPTKPHSSLAVEKPKSSVDLDKSNKNESLDLSDSILRDAMLELTNSTSIADEKRAAKVAENAIKDRLAQIAREKLGLLSREKQLQLERKKKAMAFLNQIKQPGPSQPDQPLTPTKTPTTPLGPPVENTNEIIDEETESMSIHSVTSSPRRSVERVENRLKNVDSQNGDGEHKSSGRKSRSRSTSTSSSHRRHHKRKKSKHSKKKSKRTKSSRSRSSSSRSRSKEHSHKHKRKRLSSSPPIRASSSSGHKSSKRHRRDS